MTAFFSRLSYSFGNEDWLTERRALKIKHGDRILCITASGDRPLNLLLDDCHEVVSIDANCIQNHLLHLKIAAMQELDYEQYLAFLGATASESRGDILPGVVNAMNSESGLYWLKNKQSIAKGILYQGALEKWVGKISFLMRGMRGAKIQKLFESESLEMQKDFIAKKWDRFYWRKFFDVALPFFSRVFLKDPGLYANIDPSIQPSSYLYHRMNACLTHSLARENPLLSLLFKGKVGKEAFPPYLTPDGFKIIKQRLHRISTKTSDLIGYLESVPASSFDVFSLSDVASYIPESDFVRLMHAIHRAAKPGARFSIREFLSRHRIPEELVPYFKRDEELEQHLEKVDRCFVYRFMVGQISEGK